MPVTSSQRWTRTRPCPICAGSPNMPRRRGERCTGYASDDGRYAHCQRENLAGRLTPTNATPPTYAHRLDGDCACGILHGTVAGAAPPPRRSAPRAPERRFEVRDVDGRHVATHVRIDSANGKSMPWELPDGRKGLGGMRPDALPLYGSERLRDLLDGAIVIVCEGEKAADALRPLAEACGYAVVGTVTGASGTPSDDTLRPLARFNVVLWADNDDVGRAHMQRIAARLLALGARPLVLTWGDARDKGDDAADYVARSGTAEGLRAMASAAPPYQAAAAADAVDGSVRVICMADVKREEVSWFWRPYIARGKLTLLEGDPGVGKSHVALALAAGATRGGGPPGMDSRSAASVVILTAEDGLGDTVAPRLDGMDADARRIFAIDGPLTLDGKGFSELEAVIKAHRPVLVIVDPLVAYMGGEVDMHRANEVRAITARLADLAARYDCAIVAVRHLTKGGRDRAIYRGIGSIDLTAAARSVLLVGCDATDPTNRAVVQTKSNLAPFGRAVGFALGERGFAWTGETTLTADRILAPEQGGEQRSAVDDACDFLRAALADGPRVAGDVEAEARERGIKTPTLRRARERLRVRTWQERPTGKRGGGPWHWAIVDQDDHARGGEVDQADPAANSAEVSPPSPAGAEQVDHGFTLINPTGDDDAPYDGACCLRRAYGW